jgi:hypothetical protein
LDYSTCAEYFNGRGFNASVLKHAPQDASGGKSGACVRRERDGRMARLVHIPPAKGATAMATKKGSKKLRKAKQLSAVKPLLSGSPLKKV